MAQDRILNTNFRRLLTNRIMVNIFGSLSNVLHVIHEEDICVREA
jgi:hypothetical protein